MQKKFLILFLILFIFITSSCGISQKEHDLQRTSQSNQLESNNKGNEELSNKIADENSWEFIVDKYPYVTYADIISGKFKKQYVIVSAIIESTEYSAISELVKCDLWIKYNDTYVLNSATLQCDELQNYEPKLLQSGDSIDICFYINIDNTFGFDIKGFCKNDNNITLENIYNIFKKNCSPMDYQVLMNTPNNYFSNTFITSGEVLQVIDDNNGQIILLLSLGDNEYVRIVYEYKENDSRILKGDILTVYGIFYKLYAYTTNVHDSIPNIFAYFIDNSSVNLEDDNLKSLRILLDESKTLTVTNGYRFKNSIDTVKLEFPEIYLISNWNNIQPHNDCFLIMKVKASCNTPRDSFFNFPHTIVDSNGTEYESINENFKYNYEDENGNTIDIATEINVGFVWKEDGKISAYDTNFVKGGNGTRYLVFDIPRDVALDSDSYLIFFGTERETQKDEVSSVNIHFSDYVVSP